MIKKLLFAFSIALFCFSINGYAQNPNSIEIAPFYGVQMFSAEQNQLKGNFYGGEAVFHLNMGNNKADWIKLLGVKDISFAASYRNFDNISLIHLPGSTGILGDTYGVTSRLSMSLFDIGKTEFLFNPGFGFAYSTESFYTDNSPVIGSHINFTAQIGVKAMHPLTASTRLFVGFDLYHYSNAAFKLPNEGVNSLNASLGIAQDIGSSPGPSTVKKPFVDYNLNSFEFGVNIGKRGLVQSGGGLNVYNVAEQRTATSYLYQSAIYAGYNYRISRLFSLKAGSDAVYYYKTFDINDFYNTFQERGTSYDRVRVGGALGFDIWLGRVAFEANYGRYIHFDSYYGDNYYWSFGGKLFLNKWFAIEAKQFLHGTEADFAGIGVLFKIR